MQAFTGSSTLYAVIGEFRVGDMLVQLFFFIVLLFLVKKYAWGPVIGMMQKREEYVANEIEVAEQNRAEAERASKEAAEQLRQTKEDAQKIIEDAKHIGAKQEQEIIESARQAAERIKISAQEDIQSEKEKAIQALQDKVASLSVLIASKVIEKEINAADQEKLINEYIQKVGEER